MSPVRLDEWPTTWTKPDPVPLPKACAVVRICAFAFAPRTAASCGKKTIADGADCWPAVNAAGLTIPVNDGLTDGMFALAVWNDACRTGLSVDGSIEDVVCAGAGCGGGVNAGAPAAAAPFDGV